MNSTITKHRYIILFSAFLYFLLCKQQAISSNEVNQSQEEININSINCAVPMAPNLKISFLEYLSKIIISICEEINISIDQNNFKEIFEICTLDRQLCSLYEKVYTLKNKINKQRTNNKVLLKNIFCNNITPANIFLFSYGVTFRYILSGYDVFKNKSETLIKNKTIGKYEYLNTNLQTIENIFVGIPLLASSIATTIIGLSAGIEYFFNMSFFNRGHKQTIQKLKNLEDKFIEIVCDKLSSYNQ